MKLILLDNDATDAKKIKTFLDSHNHQVFLADSKSQLIELIESQHPDLILIDPLSSEGNDYNYVAELTTMSVLPIIVISNFNDEEDCVKALSSGAEDYLTKPLRYNELLARLNKAVSHHLGASQNEFLIFDDGALCISPDSKQVFIRGNEVTLTHSEYLLLQTLANNPTKYFSRSELLDQVKGIDFDGHDRIIDSHVKDLRKKIELNPREPRYIITVHGSGYRFGPLDTLFD